MYYEDEKTPVNFITGMLLGVVVGAGLALLAAPQSGKRTRRRLLRAVSTAREGAGARWLDLAEEVQGAVRRRGRSRSRL